MTSNNYVVLNCPTLMGNRLCYSKEIKQCADVTDCVIKQVIGKCKNTCRKRCTNDCLGTKKHCGYGEILQLFDIEEINK